MKNRTYWKSHYVLETDADEIERNIKLASFTSGDKNYELVCFEKDKNAPNILISQGSGGHAYVFAELAYLIHLRGYNTFIMPRHGGHTIEDLVARERDALENIGVNYGDRIGVFAEGLGGFVTFYLGLSNENFRSMVLQNSPGILTDREFHEASMSGHSSIIRRILVSTLRALCKVTPNLPLPISLYLDWKKLKDTKEENLRVETRLVDEGYLKDPDFDRWYPISAITSLLLTPPPGPLEGLRVPTMFMVASRGFGGASYVAYLKGLYRKLPTTEKQLVEVDGSVYWMLSHPKNAANIIADWFDKTLAHV